MERQIKRQRGTGEELREKSGKPGRRSEEAREQKERQRRKGSQVRLPTLPLFGNVFQRAVIFVPEDRQWHLSITLKGQGQKVLSTETPQASCPRRARTGIR